MARWCRDQAITLIVDATHPYARRIQGAAAKVSASLGIAHVRLERPPWPDRPGWRHCADLGAALQSLPVGARVLVTSGTAGLEALDNRSDIAVIVRTISNPGPMPNHVAWLRGRPPFSMEAEVATFAHHAITHLITKNAGGTGTAKLDAAELRGVGVLMIDRPPATAPQHAEDMDEALRLAWKVHST